MGQIISLLRSPLRSTQVMAKLQEHWQPMRSLRLPGPGIPSTGRLSLVEEKGASPGTVATTLRYCRGIGSFDPILNQGDPVLTHSHVFAEDPEWVFRFGEILFTIDIPFFMTLSFAGDRGWCRASCHFLHEADAQTREQQFPDTTCLGLAYLPRGSQGGC